MLQAFGTQATPGAKTTGFVDQVRALRDLYSSHTDLWTRHLDTCRATVRAALTDARPDHAIEVMISGWGAECLPLDAINLHMTGARVIAPAATRHLRKALKPWSEINFQLADISGFLTPFADAPDTALPQKPPVPQAQTGMLISVEVISAIAGLIAPHRYRSDADEDRVRALVGAHINALRDADAPALLITPFARYENRCGKSDRLEIFPDDMLPGEPFDRWDWHIAPRGVLEPDLDVHMRVGAWRL